MNAIERNKVFRNAEDVVLYIAALMSVARADGNLHEAEKDAIIKSANLYADVLPGGRTFNELVNEFATRERLSEAIKSWMQSLACRKENLSIIRGLVVDMIMMGHCDGEYSIEEQKCIGEFAKNLGVSNSLLASLEESCKRVRNEIIALQEKINGTEST